MGMRRLLLNCLAAAMLLIAGCTRNVPGSDLWSSAPADPFSSGGEAGVAVQTPTPGGPVVSPTPDAPHPLPELRLEEDQYIVQPGDALGKIAQSYGVSLQALIDANNINDPNLLEVGQMLVIPAPEPLPTGPAFKIIPDSELVYGPYAQNLDIKAFVDEKRGYLSTYSQELDNRTYDGAAVIERIAREYSVNPRLLLAVLEYRSGWVTQSSPPEESIDYPMLYPDARRKGLYLQLAWTANNLNRGYYLWRAGGVPSWLLADGSVVPIADTINAGTAGVQQLFALLLDRGSWESAVTETGVFATYNALFGYPFHMAFEPVLPASLNQPALQLPFDPGEVWSFTGGPHGGWADGSGWAALDFAPPGPAQGCVQRDAWVVASADGLILRADIGAVVQDLDGDGNEGSGWTILYMHIENRERVQPGTYLKAGERVGHPSCEGGISTGTHLHLARRYNGEWISADGSLPFNLEGWISSGDGLEYNGFLTRNGEVVEAWGERRSENQISR